MAIAACSLISGQGLGIVSAYVFEILPHTKSSQPPVDIMIPGETRLKYARLADPKKQICTSQPLAFCRQVPPQGREIQS